MSFTWSGSRKLLTQLEASNIIFAYIMRARERTLLKEPDLEGKKICMSRLPARHRMNFATWGTLIPFRCFAARSILASLDHGRPSATGSRGKQNRTVPGVL